MDETSIERIRGATFSVARKGYEKREVERFLGQIADWLETGGGDRARADTIRLELERVATRTGAILTGAHEAAEEMHTDADAYASQTREGADAYAAELRATVDREAEEARARIAARAAEAIAAAEAKAAKTIQEGRRRREAVEAAVSELLSRRDAVLADIDRLTGELRSAVGGHTATFELPDRGDAEEGSAGTAGREREAIERKPRQAERAPEPAAADEPEPEPASERAEGSPRKRSSKSAKRVAG